MGCIFITLHCKYSFKVCESIRLYHYYYIVFILLVLIIMIIMIIMIMMSCFPWSVKSFIFTFSNFRYNRHHGNGNRQRHWLSNCLTDSLTDWVEWVIEWVIVKFYKQQELCQEPKRRKFTVNIFQLSYRDLSQEYCMRLTV
jgi:hypothetical protein